MNSQLRHASFLAKRESQKERDNVAYARLQGSAHIVHESGHEMIGFKGGKKVDQVEYSKRDTKGDPGNRVEYAVWGIDPWQSKEDRDKGNVVDGVEPQNPKNKEGQLEKNIEHSKKTDGGQSLPTVPQ